MIQNEDTIFKTLTDQGAVLIRFVDVTGLSATQNRGLPTAIFFGLALSHPYLQKVLETEDYVQGIVARNEIETDEFHLTELKAGELSDRVATMLVSDGYRAYSLSDGNQIATNAWNAETRQTPLPHKTVGVSAGVGWLGKNNLLVTPEYGSALCAGVVLTDAPLKTVQPQQPGTRCGECRVCVACCPTNALYGKAWQKGVLREEIIDIDKCTTCLQCLLHCTYTQRYLKRSCADGR